MSTRSSLILKVNQYYNENNPNNGLRYQQYYHHWDGYLSGVGVDLIRVLLKINAEDKEIENHLHSFDNVLCNELNLNWKKESFEIVHCDLEYLYLIEIDRSCNLKLSYIRTSYNSDNMSYLDYLTYKNFKPLLELRAVKGDNYSYHKLSYINYESE